MFQSTNQIYIYICTVPRTFRFAAEYNCTILLSGDNNEPSTLCFLLGLDCFYIWIDYPIRPFWDFFPLLSTIPVTSRSQREVAIAYSDYMIQWIGLRENLQETIDFPIKYGAFL